MKMKLIFRENKRSTHAEKSTKLEQLEKFYFSVSLLTLNSSLKEMECKFKKNVLKRNIGHQEYERRKFI